MIDFSWVPLLITRFAAVAPNPCNLGGGSIAGFLNFPTWYEFLPGTVDANGVCVPAIVGLSDVWLIVAAVVDILLRIASIAAIAMMVYGGFQYVTSNGTPDGTRRAQTTLANGLVGLVISVGASAIIKFVSGSFH